MATPASNTPSGALSWPARNSTLSEPAWIGEALECADSAEAHCQSKSRHDGCSWLQQLKKDLNI